MRTETSNTVSGRAQQAVAQHWQHFAMLAALAIVGQAILLASAWLLPLVSEYSLISDQISELALGRYGFVLTAAFIISGLGTLGLAYALRTFTVGAWGSLVGTLLIGIYGVGAILVALFPTDRIDSPADLSSLSTTGLIHAGVATVSFLCVTIGIVVLTWTFGRDARWRPLVLWFALFATGSVSLMIGQSLAPITSPRAGLMQRALVTIIAAWLILAALRIRTIATTEETAHPATPGPTQE
jgi:hypothetical protein